MSRADEFNAATKGLHANKIGQAFSTLTPGIDWRGSRKSDMRRTWVRAKLAIARFLLRGTPYRLEAIPPPPGHLNCRCVIVPHPEK